MSVAANRGIARRFIEEVWNGGNPTAAESLLDPALVNQGPDGQTTDYAQFLAFIRNTRSALPDIRFAINDMITEDD